LRASPGTRLSGHRRPEIGLFRQVVSLRQVSGSREIKAFGENAHDRARHAIGRDRLADNPRISAKALLPQTVADKRDAVVARLLLFG
jgi:hypothetical protein